MNGISHYFWWKLRLMVKFKLLCYCCCLIFCQCYFLPLWNIYWKIMWTTKICKTSTNECQDICTNMKRLISCDWHYPSATRTLFQTIWWKQQRLLVVIWMNHRMCVYDWINITYRVKESDLLIDKEGVWHPDEAGIVLRLLRCW